MKERQAERHNRLKQACKEAGSSADGWHGINIRENLLVINDLKILTCINFKVASTYWKNLRSRYGKNARTLDRYDSRSQVRILREYTRVLLVRHPYTRLRSAFADKFGGMHPEYIPYYAKELGGKPSTCYNVTMQQFADFLVEKGKQVGRKNSHWMPFYRRCKPCSFKYDVIAQMETFKEDMDFIRLRISKLRKEDPSYETDNADERDRWIYSKIKDVCRIFKTHRIQFEGLRDKCTEPEFIIKWKTHSLYLKGYLLSNETLNLDPETPEKWFEQCENYMVSRINKNPDYLQQSSKRKSESVRQSLRSVSAHTLGQLAKLYQHDFNIFGYEPLSVLYS